MSKLDDKKKQAVINQKSVQKAVKPIKTTKKSVIKKINPAVKAMPKKDNVKLVASKSVVVVKPSSANAQKKPVSAKSSPANTQKKSTKTKKLISKPMKHIADQIKELPSKRVWPD
ncbi:MAG: hypothetical protein L3J70_03895 [Gammaproteobacteria bacterium]|nr:hypothetical protein [Gammaproteobacteria bacterium]